LRARQIDDEGRTLSRLALYLNLPAVRDHQLAGDVQAQTHSAKVMIGYRSLEPIENPRQVLGRNPDPLVLDGEPRLRGQALDPEVYRLAGSVLQRVGQQIGDHLFDAKRIPTPGDCLAHDRQLDWATRLERLMMEPGDHLLDHLRKIDFLNRELQPPGADPR